mmetsp:Transcript_5720/g.16097  ORF Transcript_5720/g.16097 Transcript_5720/m.16097 type:complete len:283 (-) Transcript_5720:457-1305(-)
MALYSTFPVPCNVRTMVPYHGTIAPLSILSLPPPLLLTPTRSSHATSSRCSRHLDCLCIKMELPNLDNHFLCNGHQWLGTAFITNIHCALISRPLCCPTTPTAPPKDIRAGIVTRKTLLIERLAGHIRRHQASIKSDSPLVFQPPLNLIIIIVALGIQSLQCYRLDLPLIEWWLGLVQHVNFSIITVQQFTCDSIANKISNQLLVEFHRIVLTVLSRPNCRTRKVPGYSVELVVRFQHTLWQRFSNVGSIHLIANCGSHRFQFLNCFTNIRIDLEQCFLAFI